jgi:hypothetical protein
MLGFIFFGVVVVVAVGVVVVVDMTDPGRWYRRER